ncbi:amidohydrolase family protein [Methanobacterium sp.]|uniref:amidohydrolase family protein n=1 Tax=Methanobacterium sp. TaxID=2164 RepID=UPI003158BA86
MKSERNVIMGYWNIVRKFDAHVHVIPEEKRQELIKNYGETASWSKANVNILLGNMDQFNIEKALLLPINDSKTFYDMNKTNEFIASIVSKAPDRLFGFADLIIKDAYGMYEGAEELEHAIKDLGLRGLKIHPSNLNIPADDLRLIPVLRKAAELNVPVMYHSYPWGPGFYDMSSPDKINRMIKIFPDIKFITAHLGGMRYMDAIRAVDMVDISVTIVELVELYGIKITNNILRKFGVERLIFGTDFPEFSYQKYFDILDQMDFTQDEINQIAYKNISNILNL